MLLAVRNSIQFLHAAESLGDRETLCMRSLPDIGRAVIGTKLQIRMTRSSRGFMKQDRHESRLLAFHLVLVLEIIMFV